MSGRSPVRPKRPIALPWRTLVAVLAVGGLYTLDRGWPPVRVAVAASPGAGAPAVSVLDRPEPGTAPDRGDAIVHEPAPAPPAGPSAEPADPTSAEPGAEPFGE